MLGIQQEVLVHMLEAVQVAFVGGRLRQIRHPVLILLTNVAQKVDRWRKKPDDFLNGARYRVRALRGHLTQTSVLLVPNAVLVRVEEVRTQDTASFRFLLEALDPSACSEQFEQGDKGLLLESATILEVDFQLLEAGYGPLMHVQGVPDLGVVRDCGLVADA